MFSSRYGPWLREFAHYRRIFVRQYRQGHQGYGRSEGGGSSSSRAFRFDRGCVWALAGGATFSFKDHGVPDERMERGHHVHFDRSKDDLNNGWEHLYEEKEWNLRVFRRRVKEVKHEVYEYRVAGTFKDITPRHYIDAQNDVKYRSEWDQNVLTLEVLQEEGNEQLVRWVAKYPYPMYPREYVYVRRSYVSKDNKIVVIESQVVPQELVASKSSKNVRVATYTSQCAVRAHTDLDSHGLDYVLTYFDNPEANIPTYVYNWIVNQGGPYFVKQVHSAAKELEKSGRQVKSFFKENAAKPKKTVPKPKCNHSCPVHCAMEKKETSTDTPATNTPTAPTATVVSSSTTSTTSTEKAPVVIPTTPVAKGPSVRLVIEHPDVDSRMEEDEKNDDDVITPSDIVGPVVEKIEKMKKGVSKVISKVLEPCEDNKKGGEGEESNDDETKVPTATKNLLPGEKKEDVKQLPQKKE